MIIEANAGEALLTRNQESGSKVLKVTQINSINLLSIRAQVIPNKALSVMDKIDGTFFSLRNDLP